METCESEICPTENWSQKATSQCMELLANENMIKTSFQIKAQYEKCYFGDVFIERTSSKTLLNIADTLKQIDEAVDIDFESGIKTKAKSITIDAKDFKFMPIMLSNSLLELDQIEAKFREFHLNHSVHNKSNDRSDAASNISCIRRIPYADRSQSRHSAAQSVVASTIVPSEIDNGATRMKMGMRLAAPSIAPSSAQSTIVPSEINGGVTRMQKKSGLRIAPPSEISNGITPANRPNRNLATNYVNHNGNHAKRQMPPMPAGHEPDIENFRKYNS